MKKIVPAAFHQNHLNGVKASVKRPEVLELFENQLHRVFGGFQTGDSFSGSAGWADVEQPDDCEG